MNKQSKKSAQNGLGLKKKRQPKKEVVPGTLSVQQQIEEQIHGLRDSDLCRPAVGIKKFIDEYSSVLGQAQKDRAALEAAGFNWTEKMPVYDFLFTELVTTYAETQNARAQSGKKKREFDHLMRELKRERVILKEVGRHIISRPENENVVKKYHELIKEGGKAKTLLSTLDLIHFIRQFPKEAGEIRPSGMKVNNRFLQKVNRRTLALLEMNGAVVIKGVPLTEKVARQNRLLTLCLKAKWDIKWFARCAFVLNMQYYNIHYSSKVRAKKEEGEIEVDSNRKTGGSIQPKSL